MTEDFERSLWSALTPPAGAGATLDGDEDADILIVGAGFLGLSTALHLAEGGARVVLAEADQAGFGASGRNTGFVVPSLKTHLGPADVGGLIGKAPGERLVDLVGRSGTIVFDLVRRLGLDCAAEQTGWLQPAHTPDVMRTLARRRADWRARGRTVELLSAEETGKRIGADGYHGALFDPTGGQINPLAYARGLARACANAGVRIFSGTRILSIEKSNGRWRAASARGAITADRVLLTTNAMVASLRPDVLASIVPVRVHQIATQPLPPEIQARILPGRSPAADTRRHTFAARWSPDGRLLTGGMVIPGPGKRTRAARFFSRRLRHFFPFLPALTADYVWTGVIAVTMDSLPRYLTLEPGLDAAIGCNGRGVAMTTALGAEIAAMLAGRIGPDAFPLPLAPPKAIPGRLFAPYAPSAWLPWSALRDRLEAGR